MPTLLIRNVDPALHARLKARAAAHRRSLEEEARTLLRAGLARQEVAAQAEDLVALATRLFGPLHGIELDLPPRDPSQDRPPPDFSAA
ncbi:MAG: plasmid stability protein [Alphaproteobacteria bacterium]|nr:plasmid stability protein [Alphaproteobacteria bacterium]MBV9201319.1 plasmid stability protein [Alphaproteobacteria bacterium]